jgi:hypothetical protein
LYTLKFCLLIPFFDWLLFTSRYKNRIINIIIPALASLDTIYCFAKCHSLSPNNLRNPRETVDQIFDQFSCRSFPPLFRCCKKKLVWKEKNTLFEQNLQHFCLIPASFIHSEPFYALFWFVFFSFLIFIINMVHIKHKVIVVFTRKC